MSETALTAQEKKVAKEIFNAIDEDGNGSIGHIELKDALNSLGFDMSDADIAVSDAWLLCLSVGVAVPFTNYLSLS